MKTCIHSLLIICFLFCGTTQSTAQSSHNVKVVGDSVDDANSDKPNTQTHTTRTILHTGNRGATSATGNEGQPSNPQSANQPSNSTAADTSGQASGAGAANPNNSSTNVTSTTGSETTNTNCGHFCWGWLGLLGLLGLAGLIKRNPNK